MSKEINICCISSHGGHFHELMSAVSDIEEEMCWITFKTEHTNKILINKKHHFIIDPVTNKLKFILNTFEALRILIIERPKYIISTGAGIAVPFLIMGKKLFKSKIIFIESAAAVDEPSKTGRFIYKYSDLFLVQWKSLLKYFPNAKYVGIL